MIGKGCHLKIFTTCLDLKDSYISYSLLAVLLEADIVKGVLFTSLHGLI